MEWLPIANKKLQLAKSTHGINCQRHICLHICVESYCIYIVVRSTIYLTRRLINTTDHHHLIMSPRCSTLLCNNQAIEINCLCIKRCVICLHCYEKLMTEVCTFFIIPHTLYSILNPVKIHFLYTSTYVCF